MPLTAVKIIYISSLSLTIFRKLTKSDHKYKIPEVRITAKNLQNVNAQQSQIIINNSTGPYFHNISMPREIDAITLLLIEHKCNHR